MSRCCKWESEVIVWLPEEGSLVRASNERQKRLRATRLREVLMRMYQVDAFTDRLFTGNPAAVLVLEDWLTKVLMLAIAEVNNLAVSSFVKARYDRAWDP